MLPNYARPAFDPEAAKKLQKGTPRKLVTDAAKAKVGTTDKQQRAKCHVRSGGRCEVWSVIYTAPGSPRVRVFGRCPRRVSQNHHLLGGIGRRNKGRSILAEHRLDVCEPCHKDLTGNVLTAVDGTLKENAATVRYERRKA